MKIDISIDNLKFFKALSSETRLKIIGLLVDNPLNIKDISEKLSLSTVIISKHIKILEEAKIIGVEVISAKRGTQKRCNLYFQDYSLFFSKKDEKNNVFVNEYDIPIGSYSNYDVKPTCGIATTKKILGICDDPRYFSHLDRYKAGILWFKEGWVEYTIPSFNIDNKTIEKLEFSLELSSEYPKFNSDYKSDIYFYINDICLGSWTAPGDFGDKKGKYTPSWWFLSEYGVVKKISISKRGTFINGIKISDINLKKLGISSDKDNIFKISSPRKTQYPGGINLFGNGFGNKNHGILLKTYHKVIK